MNAEQLSKVGSDLVRRCGTRDPFQIANALGINVMDDCENLGSLKGMYCIVKRNRFIFLNKDLSPQMKRIVCAHEIGHDRLHRALAKNMACNGVQREHNKKLDNGLPILHKVPPKRDYGRYFCIMAEKGGTSHGGLTEKLSPFFVMKTYP